VLIQMINISKLLLLQFARQYSRNEALTLDWLCRNIGWPFAPPKTIIDLVHLEAVFDVLDLYLWFRYDVVCLIKLGYWVSLIKVFLNLYREMVG